MVRAALLGHPKGQATRFSKTISARPLLITPGRENSARVRVGGKGTEAEDEFNRVTPSLRATHRDLVLNQQLASPEPRLRAAPMTAPPARTSKGPGVHVSELNATLCSRQLWVTYCVTDTF